MRTGLVFCFFLFCAACNNGKPGQRHSPASAVLPPQYYFFPKANVYFDSANKDYLFQTGDSAGWVSQKQIPLAVQRLMDKSVFISNPPQPVWKENAAHKLIYSAALYATAADTVEKKVLPQIVAKKDTVEKKKRSGIRRFFDKLFGGKKKKKEAE